MLAQLPSAAPKPNASSLAGHKLKMSLKRRRMVHSLISDEHDHRVLPVPKAIQGAHHLADVVICAAAVLMSLGTCSSSGVWDDAPV